MIKANFSAYSKYVTDSLHQWDINQVLQVTGLNLTTAPEVHFSNANTDRAIVRQATMQNHVVSVNIPNSLLQDPLRIYAHIGIYEGSTFKVVELVELPVQPRKRPMDYQIQDSDEELYSFKRLENLLEDKATKAQVANIVAGVGSDAELVDVRYGADGKTYASAGEAVREQFNVVKFDVNDAANGFITFTPTLFERGGMVYADGQNIPTGYEYRIRSKAVALADSDIVISAITDGFLVRIFRYTDESGKALVSGVWEYTNEHTPVTIPSGTYYRFAVLRIEEDTSEKANIKEFSAAIKMDGEVKCELDEMRKKVASVDPGEIKFGVYNIGHFAQGRDTNSTTPTAKLFEAYRAVGCLDCDIVGIVEDLTYTGTETAKEYKYVDTEKTVTSEEFYNNLFSHKAMGPTNGTNVNSVYAQYPLRASNIVMFDSAAQNRYFNHVKCTYKGVELNVIVTHLDWDTAAHRYSQVEQILAYIRDNELEKVIVCGDFNASEEDNTFKLFSDAGLNLANQGIYGEYTTFAYDGLTASYDNIITTSDLKITNVKVHDEIAFSDHYPMTVTIRW